MNTPVRIAILSMMVLLLSAVPAIEGSSSGKHSQASSGCTCHSSVGGVSVSHNFPSTYLAGAMYTVTISVQSGGSPSSGGFNVEIDKGQFMSPGTGVNINQAGDSVTHTSGNQITWTFDWMAPFGTVDSLVAG